MGNVSLIPGVREDASKAKHNVSNILSEFGIKNNSSLGDSDRNSISFVLCKLALSLLAISKSIALILIQNNLKISIEHCMLN